jgi:hypothetical protein
MIDGLLIGPRRIPMGDLSAMRFRDATWAILVVDRLRSTNQ